MGYQPYPPCVAVLLWPDMASPRYPVTTYGPRYISWTELVISFMLWSNRKPPIRIKDGKSYQILPYDDPKVQLLPINARSLRVLAENFRWIVKHIQTFSRTKIIPTCKKQGTSSLTRLGFTSDHEGGISRRHRCKILVTRMDLSMPCLKPCLTNRLSIQMFWSLKCRLIQPHHHGRIGLRSNGPKQMYSFSRFDMHSSDTKISIQLSIRADISLI